MPQITESTMVGAPAGEVWTLLRDFAAIGTGTRRCRRPRSRTALPTASACVRVFPLAGGHRETLVALDDQQRRIAFTFADHAAGLPVRSYTSTITARPVTLTDHTYVEWSSRFDCDEADEDKAIAASP